MSPPTLPSVAPPPARGGGATDPSAGAPPAGTDRSMLPALVEAAAAGDRAAWDAIVNQYGRLLWTVARSVGLSGADAADVCQATWMQLVTHLDSIQHPERIGAWLVTTARREAIRVSQRGRRCVPSGDDPVLDHPGGGQIIDITDAAIERDEHAMRCVRTIIEGLPERSRLLIALLATDPTPSYLEISKVLDMPIGSIGPTRARAMERVRDRLADRGISLEDVYPLVG